MALPAALDAPTHPHVATTGDLPPGTIVAGQFRVVRPLARGGFGVVHLAEQLQTGTGEVLRPAVVKVLHTGRTLDEATRTRFDREAKALLAIDHHGLVRLLAFGNLPSGQPFLVLEHGGEMTLDEARVAAGGRLATDRALRIMEKICDALDEAHRTGILHRDLKPHNVMTTLRNGEDRIKVVDLGLARLLEEARPVQTDPAWHTLTDQGIFIGTPHYASPEQSRGQKLDARSDLYAAGCMLYELLTGRPPFAGRSAREVVMAQITMEPPPPESIGVTLAPAVRAVLLKMLEKKPEARIQTAALLREALADARRAAAANPVEAALVDTQPLPVVATVDAVAPGSMAEGKSAPASRLPVFVVGGLVAVVAAIAAGIGFSRADSGAEQVGSPMPVVTPVVAAPPTPEPPAAVPTKQVDAPAVVPAPSSAVPPATTPVVVRRPPPVEEPATVLPEAPWGTVLLKSPGARLLLRVGTQPFPPGEPVTLEGKEGRIDFAEPASHWLGKMDWKRSGDAVIAEFSTKPVGTTTLDGEPVDGPVTLPAGASKLEFTSAADPSRIFVLILLLNRAP